MHVDCADQFPPKAAHVDRLDGRVLVQLVLESVIEVFRIRRPEVWISHERKRNLRREECSRETSCPEWEWVRQSDWRKRVRQEVRRGCHIRWLKVQVENVSKGRLSAELQVERAVFEVVKNSAAAAHDQLAIAEHVPGKSNARSKVIVIRVNERAVRRPRITGIQNSWRRIRKYRGLGIRTKETKDVVVDIVLRAVVLIPHAEVQRQSWSHLNRVLSVVVLRRCPDGVDRVRKLEEVSGEASHKIS